jgi:hypothetical protein
MPWDRPSIIAADMFGELGDDPELRRRRELERQRLDAEAEYQARAAQPRAWETPQSIAQETFNPLLNAFAMEQPFSRRGMTALPAKTEPEVIHAGRGSAILRRDPFTGQIEEIWKDNVPTKETTFKVPFSVNAMDTVQDTIPMTAAEIREAYQANRLPAAAKESEVVKYVLSQPAPTVSQAAPVSPLLQRRDSSGFIGEPGYDNSFDSSLGRRSPFDIGFEQVRGSAPATPAPRAGGGIRILSVKRRQ